MQRSVPGGFPVGEEIGFRSTILVLGWKGCIRLKNGPQKYQVFTKRVLRWVSLRILGIILDYSGLSRQALM